MSMNAIIILKIIRGRFWRSLFSNKLIMRFVPLILRLLYIMYLMCFDPWRFFLFFSFSKWLKRLALPLAPLCTLQLEEPLTVSVWHWHSMLHWLSHWLTDWVLEFPSLIQFTLVTRVTSEFTVETFCGFASFPTWIPFRSVLYRCRVHQTPSNRASQPVWPLVSSPLLLCPDLFPLYHFHCGFGRRQLKRVISVNAVNSVNSVSGVTTNQNSEKIQIR